jgi:hypothetical protein
MRRRLKAKELTAMASSIRGSRFALIKGVENLNETQIVKLDDLKKAGSHLFKAWELKEDLRAVFKAASAEEADDLLDDWLKASLSMPHPTDRRSKQKGAQTP